MTDDLSAASAAGRNFSPNSGIAATASLAARRDC